MKINSGDKLTIILRLKLCLEILTKRSGHNHSAQVKGLSVFECGYHAGFVDAMPRVKSKPIFREDVV